MYTKEQSPETHSKIKTFPNYSAIEKMSKYNKNSEHQTEQTQIPTNKDKQSKDALGLLIITAFILSQDDLYFDDFLLPLLIMLMLS